MIVYVLLCWYLLRYLVHIKQYWISLIFKENSQVCKSYYSIESIVIKDFKHNIINSALWKCLGTVTNPTSIKNSSASRSGVQGPGAGRRRGPSSSVLSSGLYRQPSSKTFREGSESGTSSFKILPLSMILITTYPSLALSSTSLPKMRKAPRKLLTSFLGNLIKTCISEHFMSEISSLHVHSQIKVLRNRMDSMEQYYRCTCLKFSGITEERGGKYWQYCLKNSKPVYSFKRTTTYGITSDQ